MTVLYVVEAGRTVKPQDVICLGTACYVSLAVSLTQTENKFNQHIWKKKTQDQSKILQLLKTDSYGLLILSTSGFIAVTDIGVCYDLFHI